MKSIVVRLIIIALCIISLQVVTASAESPVTDEHINSVNTLFTEQGIKAGYVDLDRYGRLELRGEYYDGVEVDRAFSLAQTVVGVKWVSPVTPENIRVKEWEKRLGSLFSRARVLKPQVRGDESPGPVRNRYALVVGVGKFLHGINTLQYSVRDATEFFRFISDPRRGGIPRQNVTFLTDQEATRAAVSQALRRIRDLAEPDDLVVVYMSSHGTPPDKFGGVHIVTYDTEVKPRERVWHTSLTEDMLKEFVEELKARRLVMILDTCYSNGAYKGVPGFLPPGGKSLGSDEDEGYGISRDYGKRLLGAKDIVLEEETTRAAQPKSVPAEEEGWGKVLISASGAGEKSWESDNLHNSIFTYYFLEGLSRHNGSLKDSFYYAKPLVSQKVKQEKGVDIEQNPQVMATQAKWDMRLTPQKR